MPIFLLTPKESVFIDVDNSSTAVFGKRLKSLNNNNVAASTSEYPWPWLGYKGLGILRETWNCLSIILCPILDTGIEVVSVIKHIKFLLL